ncbi:MAG: hypothetical protein HKN45_07275, partial [Flavobacteriales bacterium]|nr:hypothetical protein [Flavobacteriales bacterium]
MVTLKLKSEITEDPNYTGTENEVGSCAETCPLQQKDEDEQRIIEVFFSNESGQKIQEIKTEEKVQLVVKTENMSGEDLVIDLPDNAGIFKLGGEEVTDEKVLVLNVGSDEEKIELDVQPLRLGFFERWVKEPGSNHTEDLNDTDTTLLKEVKDAFFAELTVKDGIASFKRLDKGVLGQEVYILVETSGLVGSKLKLNVRQNGSHVLAPSHEAIHIVQNGSSGPLAEVIVGGFSSAKKSEYNNSKDFENWGIAKITLGPKSESKMNEYSAAIADATGAKTQVELLVEVDGAGGEVKYCGKNPSSDPSGPKNVWLDAGSKAFVVTGFTINIYHNGKISNVNLSKSNKVSYRYVESNDTVHDLGTFSLTRTQKWIRGSKTAKTGWVKKIVGGKTRYYQKDGAKTTELMTPFSGSPKSFKYSSGNVAITLHENTSREYFNPIAFACLLGALAEDGYEDVVTNGSVGP